MLVTTMDPLEQLYSTLLANRIKSGRRWQGGHACAKTPTPRMAPTIWRCLPVQTPIVIASTSSTPATSVSPNGWARISPSAACTATTASIASASGRARSCNIPSCRSRSWCGCSSVPANAPTISTTSNWNAWRNPSRPLNSTSCTDAFAKTRQKRGAWPAHVWAAAFSTPSRIGSKLGSRGSGGQVAVPDRPASGSTHAGDGGRTDGLGGDALLLGRCFAPALAALDRRSSALPQRDPASVRPDPSSPPQAWTGAAEASRPQSSAAIARGRGGKSPQRHRQAAARSDAGVVRRQKENRAADPQTQDRPADQHCPCGTPQRHVAQSAGAADSPHPQRFAAERGVAVVAVAVARPVQLGPPAWLVARPHTGDGDRPGDRAVECGRICVACGACQRFTASDPRRATTIPINKCIGRPNA